jgi:CBS domain containing-hemolysin-like protein
METILIVSVGITLGALVVGSSIRKIYEETGDIIFAALGLFNMMIYTISGSVCIVLSIALIVRLILK